MLLQGLFPLCAVLLAKAPPDIVAAEWAFIRHCERAGINAAFVEAFHPEGLIFRPDPVNGREWYGKQPESKARLDWTPAMSFTAASDDLGYNTGPWTWRPAADAEPKAHGWFFSVWKRDGQGAWKLLWDLGVPTQEPAGGVATLRAAPKRSKAPPAAALSEAQALQLDRAFAAQAAGPGLLDAYRTRLAPEGRLFRSPQQPAAGWAAAQALLAASPGSRTWEPKGTVAARSGEILFVHGAYTRSREGHPAETGSYLRAWRRLGAVWTLEIDLECPRPPERKQ